MHRHYQNVERIIAVARQLGELAQNVVFVGGASTGLLITDPVFPDVRPTIDMHSDITTLENHLKVMRDYRKRRKNECGA